MYIYYIRIYIHTYTDNMYAYIYTYTPINIICIHIYMLACVHTRCGSWAGRSGRVLRMVGYQALHCQAPRNLCNTEENEKRSTACIRWRSI